MDAVLPLTVADVARARLLFRSLTRFVEGLETVWVYTPDDQAQTLQAELVGVPLPLRVRPETDIVPELRPYAHIGGWYKQQMIKLAAARAVRGPFYLTLDADVVATRDLRVEQLTPEGRALTHIINEDLHPRWYRRVESLLGEPLPRRGVVHNVTPAVLSAPAAIELLDEMGERMRRGRYSPGLRGVRQRWARLRWGSRPDPGHLYLLAGLPWTEYALYYSFVELRGRLEHHHRISDRCIYDIEGSVWFRPQTRLTHWDPAASFQGEGPPWFLVVQSNTGLEPGEVERSLNKYFA